VIVADVNLIAYLRIPGDQTDWAERVLLKDPNWVAPKLWRSEFRNVLTQYFRRDLINMEFAMRCLAGTEAHVQSYSIPSARIMNVVERSTCSAYDCEYVALAESLGVKLVTADKQICRQFPGIAINLKEFAQ
jgi:predicted nucleic acid-binding protein